LASFKILTSATWTSMAPVASLGFRVPGGRAFTTPFTASTNSFLTDSAFA
jgi:hypothetical protein